MLYAPPAVAPQLTNTGPWKAPPILVSGASAYRDGEFLYQDFLYDDHGARRAARPRRPAHRGRHLFSLPSGTYTYPTDPRLREQRGRPRRAPRQAARRRHRLPRHAQHAEGPVAGRPSRSRSAAPPAPRCPCPHGAERQLAGRRCSSPSTAARAVAELVHAATGAPVAGAAPTVTVDTRRAARSRCACPTRRGTRATSTVRLAAGVGPVGQRAATATSRRGPAADATASRRRGHSGRAAGVLQRRLPARRALPDPGRRQRTPRAA